MSPEQREKRQPTGKGVIFLLYHNRQILVEKVINEESGAFGHTLIPGGKIEEGEMPAEAAAREIREELGVIPQKLYLLAEFNDITLDDEFCKFHAFLITEWKGNVVGQELTKSEIRWINYSTARKALDLASSQLVISEAEKVLKELGQLPKD